MRNESFDNIIEEIEKSVNDRYRIFTSMGVTNGLAGVSLFYFYYTEMANNRDDFKDLCIRFLEKAIDGLNETYNGPNIITDIIEIGHLLHFYYKKQLLSRNDILPFFKSYNPLLKTFLIESLENNSISPAIGAIKYGNYFLELYDFIEEKKLVEKILTKIENKAIIDKKSCGLFWISEIEREGLFLTEFGIKHGILGIMDFLVKLHERNIERDRVEKLLDGSLLYLMTFSNLEGKAFFPFDSTSLNEKSRSFGTIYGDLGIAYGLFKVSQVLRNAELELFVKDILDRFCLLRDTSKEKVLDANLLYGCLGVASVLKLLNGMKPSFSLDEPIKYWLYSSIDIRNIKNEWAGFDSVNNKFDINTQLSFAHGIIGIGIALINFVKEENFEFLEFINYRPLLKSY